MADGKSSANPWNDCNAAVKPYYYPVEAAIRWCGLVDHEAAILAEMQFPRGDHLPPIYPQWPCLRQRTELIFDAMYCGELPHGRDGSLPDPNDHVAKARRTVRHNDLKAWMVKCYPGQKPSFLFDEIERATHSAFNADSFRALQADRDAAQAELKKAADLAHGIKAERDALLGERDSLRAMVDRAGAPGGRSETTYLNIIGGLLGLMLGKTPAGKPQSVFGSRAAIIEALVASYPGKPGIAESTLKARFADANKSLDPT